MRISDWSSDVCSSDLRDRALPGKWPPMPQLPELVTRGRIMFDQFVAAADARLGVSAYLAGDRFSYADIALVLALDFGRRGGWCRAGPVQIWPAGIRKFPRDQAWPPERVAICYRTLRNDALRSDADQCRRRSSSPIA